VPIIAITAHDSADYRAEAEEVGFDEYLTKPIDFDRLESAIHRLLQRDAA
jgi:DNA-binding response OmpR family regulator